MWNWTGDPEADTPPQLSDSFKLKEKIFCFHNFILHNLSTTTCFSYHRIKGLYISTPPPPEKNLRHKVDPLKFLFPLVRLQLPSLGWWYILCFILQTGTKEVHVLFVDI